MDGRLPLENRESLPDFSAGFEGVLASTVSTDSRQGTGSVRRRSGIS